MRIVFVSNPGELLLGGAIFLDINLRDASEQLREHKVAILRPLDVEISGSTEHVRSITRRHRLLLLCTDDQHRVVEAAHHPLRAEQHRERTGSARGFRVHRWDAVESWIDLGHECAEMQLLGKLSAVEIPDCRSLDVRRIDLCILERRLACLDDQMPERLALFLEVALKVGPAAAEDVYGFHRLLIG